MSRHGRAGRVAVGAVAEAHASADVREAVRRGGVRGGGHAVISSAGPSVVSGWRSAAAGASSGAGEPVALVSVRSGMRSRGATIATAARDGCAPAHRGWARTRRRGTPTLVALGRRDEVGVQQQGAQNGVHLQVREGRTDTPPPAAAERDPAVRVGCADESVRIKAFGIGVEPRVVVDGDAVDVDERAGRQEPSPSSSGWWTSAACR